MAKHFDARAKWADREKQRRAREPKPRTPKMPKAEWSMPFMNSKDVSSFFSVTMDFGGSSAPKAPPAPAVEWDHVIGQVEAKAAVREAIEGATKHADLYKRYGRKPAKGVLLFGPPGNGKTMLGKAAASALAKQHGQAARESGFILVKGPEILSMYLGESEKKIRDLFARARDHRRNHGFPAVIFVDEAESILGHRREHSMSATLVPMFLAEMDGMQESAAFVLLATNRPGSLDSAVIREGRIDRKVLVGRPSQDDARAIFGRCLHGRPIGGTLEEVVDAAVAELYDTRHVLYAIHMANGSTRVVTLGAFASGAQLTFLVDAAASFAIEREIATGVQGGIEAGDFRAAIVRTLKEQRELDHPTELAAFCEDIIGEIVRLERVRSDGVVAKRASLITAIPEGVSVSIVPPVGITVPQC